MTTLLAPVKTRAEKATPSPWKADTGVRGDCVVWGPNGRFLMNMQAEPHWLEYPGEKRMVSFDVDARDAAFIAAARTDAPRLVAALEAVNSLIEKAMSEPAYLLPGGYPSKPIEAHELRAAVVAALGGGE